MLKRRILLLCNGVSGSGKTTFIKNQIANWGYNLKSMTTRGMRDGELWGERYYFVNEDVFNTVSRATTLFVNKDVRKPDEPKWLYGVPEFEIMHNLDKNLIYDVIEPQYSRQLIDWFNKKGLNKHYEYRIMWFLPPSNATDIVKQRANMPGDVQVRTANTCDAIDFLRANLQPNYWLKYTANEQIVPTEIDSFKYEMRLVSLLHGYVAPKQKEHVLEALAERAIKDKGNTDFRSLASQMLLQNAK